MAAVTILQWFWSQENKICHCFYFYPIYLPWWAKNDQLAIPTSSSEKTLYPLILHTRHKNWHTSRTWNHGDGWWAVRVWDCLSYLPSCWLQFHGCLRAGDSWVRDKKLDYSKVMAKVPAHSQQFLEPQFPQRCGGPGGTRTPSAGPGASMLGCIKGEESRAETQAIKKKNFLLELTHVLY